ncbi:MAG: repeat containing protein [Herbinix sp.]|jgi:glucose/arabinose dehydrogenase|nr:repeat containing protein [Herbinix sp.]
MISKEASIFDQNLSCQTTNDQERYLNPADIYVSNGYRIEVYATGLNFPVNMVFTEYGEILIAESGCFSQNPRILRYSNGVFQTVAQDFNVPLSGINYYNGDIYVSHRGTVTVIHPDGSRTDIISGLPSNGDFTNNKVEIGPDNKLYFGQGSATNSGIVGTDNQWVRNFAFLHDYPGAYIMLQGQNYITNNMLLPEGEEELVYTGAFSPYGVSNYPYEVRKGIIKATGSILRANLDGTQLEQYAWGLRNAVRLKFDSAGNLFAANQGFDARGSRPIANATDHIYAITQGLWYGWPDFSAGEPVTSRRFIPEGGQQVEFLLTNHPNDAPVPFAIFPSNSNIMGFDINYYEEFSDIGDFYVAEFGSTWQNGNLDIPNVGIGHRISRTSLYSGGSMTFAVNRSGFMASYSGEGGFGWPTDVVMGPDRSMYILDFGSNPNGSVSEFLPYSGVIWRIFRE